MRRVDRSSIQVLYRCLEPVILRLFGSRTGIAAIQQRPFRDSTAYACDILTIELTTGFHLTVFLKDFGFSRLPKDGVEQRCEREMRVYRDLLAYADLGTARYYGSIWDESQGRFWLLLEFVEGSLLRDCHVPHWIAAAGWLGRLHGHYAQQLDRLSECSFLQRHDVEYFESRAERATRAVSRVAPGLTERLAVITGQYDRLVGIMASQPPTLIHGSYRPQNILVTLDSELPRICPVDWELSALGSPLLDLAFIADGFEPPTLDLMYDAYRDRLIQNGVSLPGREEMVYIVNCFRLHKVVKSLGESLDRQFPETVVAKLVALGEQLCRRV